MNIKNVNPNQFMVGEVRDIVIIGSGFVKERQSYEVETEKVQGKRILKSKEKEYETFLPYISCSAPGVTFENQELISPAVMKAIISIPESCPPSSYDIFVTNPDGTQITGTNLLEIQALPANHTLCPYCQEVTEDTKRGCEHCYMPLHDSLRIMREMRKKWKT